ncbi:MAG TPA: hypothetical protein VLV83_10550 [Acidobacteriota bacterium]|nr:hypothetical protein [Acidobacteriota bacterium]
MLRYFFVVMVSLFSLGITMIDGPGSTPAGSNEAESSNMITFIGGIPPMERCLPYPQCMEDKKKEEDSGSGGGD